MPPHPTGFSLPGDTAWLPGQELPVSPWDLVRKPLSQSITIRLKGNKKTTNWQTECVLSSMEPTPDSELPSLVTSGIWWIKGPNKCVWMHLKRRQCCNRLYLLSCTTWRKTPARAFIRRSGIMKQFPVKSHLIWNNWTIIIKLIILSDGT